MTEFKTPLQRKMQRANSHLSFNGQPLPISDAPNNVRKIPMTVPKTYIPWNDSIELKSQEEELKRKNDALAKSNKYFERAAELSKRPPLLRQAQMKTLNAEYGITDENTYNKFISDFAKLIKDTETLANKYNLTAENEKIRYKLWQESLRPYGEVQDDINTLDKEVFNLEKQRSKNIAKNITTDGVFLSPNLRNAVPTEEGKLVEAELLKKINDAKEKRSQLVQEKNDALRYYYSSLRERENFSENNGRDATGKIPRNPLYSDREAPASSYATDEELEIFNYLYNTEGSKSANDYASFMSDTWNRRKAEEKVAKTENLPAVLEQLSKIKQSFGTGIEQAFQGMYSAATGKTTNTTAQQMASSKYINNTNAAGKVFYGLGQTIGNMAPGILLSAVTGTPTSGLVSIGVSSGGNAYNEARKKGASKADAYAYGTLVGTSEAILGKALGGISSLGGGKIGTAIAAKLNAADKAFLAVAGKLAANGMSEGVEEGLQTILEPIFATMVLDEKYKPAQFSDVAYSALLGFLSAGFLEGGNTASEYFNSPLDRKVIDKYISDGKKAAENSLERAIADDIKSKLAANPNAKLTGFDIGRIARYYKDTRKAEKKANKELKKTLIEATEKEMPSPVHAEMSSEHYKKESLDGQKSSIGKSKSDSFYISKDTDGEYFVDVTEDILDTNNGESIARTLQRVISEKFNNLISANDQKFQINKITNDEFRKSGDARTLEKASPDSYKDKLRTIANADEIIKSAKNWINEDLKHTRKDDIVSFGHGEISYRVGNNGYSADVLVGIRKNGAAVLYDLINISGKTIVEAPATRANHEGSPRILKTSTGTDYTTSSSESQPSKSTSEPKQTAGQTFSEQSVANNKNSYSIRSFSDGTRFVNVDTDQNLFDGLNKKQQIDLATKILKERFQGKVIGETNKVFVNGVTIDEYAHPSKHFEDDAVYEAKLRASPELHNLMDAGTNFRSSDDGQYGHTHADAIDFSYFDVIFKVGNEYYKGIINIKNIAKGKLLKDITKIENITPALTSRYGGTPWYATDSNVFQSNDTTSSSESQPPKNTTVSRDGIEIKSDTDPEIQSRIAAAQDELERTGILSGASETTINTVRRLSKLLKTDIRFEYSPPIKGRDGRVYNQNGRYNFDEGIIYVNMGSNESAYLQIIAHEFVHSVEGTKLYTLLEKYARKFHNGKAGEGAFDAEARTILAQYEAAGKNYDIRKAQAEVVSNYVAEHLLNNEANIERLVKENRTLAERLKDIVDKVLSAIGKDSTKAEAQTRAKLTRMSKLLNDALEARDSRTNKTSDIKSRYKELRRKILNEEISEEDYEAELDELDNEALSVGLDLQELMSNGNHLDTMNSYSLNINAAEELHKALYDKKYSGEVLLRDNTPKIMLSQKGVKDLPMSMNASHIRENVFTEAEAKKLGLKIDEHTHYHGLGEKFFIKIIDSLDNVTEAYRGTKNAENTSRAENYFLLISNFKDNGGNTINVPVYIDEKANVNQVFIDVNKISTAFGRENFRDYINRQIHSKNLVRIKNRNTADSESSALIAKDYINNASMNSIYEKSEKVNSKIDVDYLSAVEHGDMETAQKMVDEAAEKAFSKSSIRDEDGKLIKVYHGSDADFPVFDKTKGRSSMDIQGMFFSPWEIDAAGYGSNVRAFYLNIANPAPEQIAYRTLRQHQQENYAGIKARDSLEKMGYDGVNNENEEYIAFYPEQIKSADAVTYDDNGNVIPLSQRFDSGKDDIRFSITPKTPSNSIKNTDDEALSMGHDSQELMKDGESKGGISYSLTREELLSLDINWEDDNFSTLKEQLKEHLEEVNAMEPVTEVVYDKNTKKSYYTIFKDILKKWGNKIETQHYGSIIFDSTSISDLGNYTKTDAEKAAALAAPYVIKRGIVIAGHKNHKNSGSTSITFAAPVIINDNRGNVAVSVIYGKGRVHSLRILTPGGKEFVLSKKEDAEPRTTNGGFSAGRRENTTKAPHISSASIDSIPQPNENVNSKKGTDSYSITPKTPSNSIKNTDDEALSMGHDSQELMKDGESYSISKETAKSAITLDDVNALRSIGRKSINKFTKEDIEKSQKWAKRFYEELGVKSPFFRAWFGEWRAEDTKTRIDVADIPEYVPTNEFRKQNRGTVKNSDTGWNIRISREGETNTISHSGKEKLSEYGLSGIQELVKNSVFLDSEVHEHHSNNAKEDHIAFDHKLYAFGKTVDGVVAIYRITVEDYFQSKTEPSNKRFHNLKHIKKIAEITGGRTSDSNRSGGSTNSDPTINYSIYDLYKFVKMYDEEFTLAPKANRMLLNKDRTPKVFYHGTDKPFTEFKLSELRSREGSFFFAESREDAEGYGKYVHEVYLRCEKLADYDNQPREFYQLKDKKAQVEYLKKKGYDGWYSDMDSGGWGEVSVFSPEQIKSAKPQGDSMGNVGTFSKYESDIRFSITPKTPSSSIKNTDDEALSMGHDSQELMKDGESYSISETTFSDTYVETLLSSFNISNGNIKDYIYVQRNVMHTLEKENFFTNSEKRNRIDVNEKTGLIIETNKSGIYETFNEHNFKKVGIRKKYAKLATIRRLPEIIRNGDVIADNVSNYHSQTDDNKKFAYIQYTIEEDGKNIVVQLDIKKSPRKNKFWVNKIIEIKNISSLSASTENGTEAEQTTTDKGSIPQPNENVNSKKGTDSYSITPKTPSSSIKNTDDEALSMGHDSQELMKDGESYYASEPDKISLNTTDEERTRILNKKTVTAPIYEGQTDEAISTERIRLESEKIGLVKKAIEKIAKDFAPLGEKIHIEDADVTIVLSKSNLKESISKEVSPVQLAKLLPVLKESLSNSIAIERHANRYYFDTDTIYFDNLLGGYIDVLDFVPIRYGLKYSKNGKTTLYVVVDQNKIPVSLIEQNKKTEVVKTTAPLEVESSASRSVAYSISQIIPFVNSKDLLRYIPDGLLSDKQKSIKWQGIAETISSTNEKNDKKYFDFISEHNINAAKKMVIEAAKTNGYTYEAWHETRHTFNEFSKYTRGLNTHTEVSKGWFFAADKDTANSYYPYGVTEALQGREKLTEKGNLYHLFLKMDNPLVVDVADYDYDTHMEKADAWMEFVEQAEQNGNDGIILYNALNNQLKSGARESTVYMFRDPNQAKSVETIVKDENDNIVPISRRFNSGKDDIRYSITPKASSNSIKNTDDEALSMGHDSQELMKNGESYSISKETAKSAITLDDVNALRSIGRKSINKFTKKDIEKAQKWAKRFYEELGVKSPFFRAWFGEWRGYKSNSPSGKTKVVQRQGELRGKIKNNDTGWEIIVSRQVSKETNHHSSEKVKNAIKYLPYIEEITENAVLLDTVVSDKENKLSAFFHSMYAYTEAFGYPALLKVKVEELVNEKTGEPILRDYILQDIEEEPISKSKRFSKAHLEETDSSIVSISDLVELVKTYDEEFTPSFVADEHLLKDGRPKVFYHGTDKPFTEFKLSELRSREGSFFFAESREDAEGYGKYVHEVYLRGEKLADYDNQPREFYQLKDKKAQVEYLKKKGYDGWYSDMDSGGWGEVSVFSPEQIKSAKPQGDSMGNVGTFSKYESDIRFSITPEKTAEESIDKSTSDVPVVTRLPIQSLGKLRAVEKGLCKVIGDIYKIKYARVDELKPAIRKFTEKYLSEGKITAEDITEFTDFIKNTFGIESTKEDTNRVKYQLNEAINEDLVYIRNFFVQFEKNANAQPEWVQESREERAKRFSNKKIREFRNRVRDEFSVPESERETLDALISNVVARVENGTVPKDVIDSFFGAVFNSAEVTEDSLKKDFPDVYKMLRYNKLTLTDSEKTDLVGYDSYKEFREDAKGYLNLGKDGTSVDDMYAFCHSFAPSLFPDSIDNTNDQAVRLLEVSKMFTPRKHWAFEEMTQEEREKLYDEFTKQVLDLARDVTTSQKYAQGTSTIEQESEVESNDVDVEEFLDVMEKMKKERRKMLSVRGRTILSERDEGALKAIFEGHITVEQLNEEYNKKDIKAIYEASKEYIRLKNMVDEQKRQIRLHRYDMAKKYLADGDVLTGFRDRSHAILYMLNPMERNLRYIGRRSQLSEDLIDAYIKPIKRANRNAILYKNSIVKKIESLALSRKVKAGDEFSEAYAVQFVGEAENNIKYLKKLKDNRATKDGHSLDEWQDMLNEFWKVNPGIDRNKIYNAVDVFREVYDDLFKKMNEARVRNGYEPISYRQGYFPHFSPKECNDTLAQFGKTLGINVEFSGLPTDINGLTQNFRPGMRYQAFANERLGFETVFDAVEGLHRYLDTAADVIYQTDNICNLRALTQQIRYQASDEGKRKREDFIRSRSDLDETERAAVLDKIHEGGKYTLSNFVNDLEEYTNLLAGKKSKWDRGAEALLGRSFYGLMKNVSGRIAANMVSWNVGSWLTNFIPLVQGATGLDTKYMLVGMKEAMLNVYEADGFESQSVWLTTRRGSEELLKQYELTNIPTTKIGKALDKETFHKIGRILDKSAEIGMIPMEAIDMFVSNTLVRGRYHQNMDKGMDGESAIQEADSWVAGIMGDRSKGGLPTIFGATNPMVKLLTQFQVEVANQIGFFFSDLPIQLRDKEAKAIVLAVAKYIIGAYLYNELYELLTGRRPALDPLGIINNSIGDFSGRKFRDPVDTIVSLAQGKNFLDEAYKMPIGEAMWEFTMELAEETPFIGGLLSGGRIPISSALPSLPNIVQSVGKDGALRKVGKELLKPVTYSILPGGGGQISKTVKGISAVAHGGKYGKDNKGREILQYPITPNPWTAIQSTLFGPTATKGGREWINSNFSTSLSFNETRTYKAMVNEGLTQDRAFDVIEDISAAGDKKVQKVSALKNADIPAHIKRVAYEQMFLSSSPKREAILNALDRIGAYRDVVIDFLLEHPDINSKKEVMTIWGDSEKSGRLIIGTKILTTREKAAILQVVTDIKDNPYWEELRESVYYEVHPEEMLKDGKKKSS